MGKCSSQKGAVMVETALSIGLFLSLTLALFSFGILLTEHALISQGLNEAVRTGAVNSGSCYQVTQVAESSFHAYIERFKLPLTVNSVHAQVERRFGSTEDGLTVNLDGLALAADVRLAGLINRRYEVFYPLEDFGTSYSTQCVTNSLYPD